MDELVLRIGPAERAALEELARADRAGRTVEELGALAVRAGVEHLRSQHGRVSDERPARRQIRTAFATGGLVGLVVVLVGGYGYRWSWTGFPDNNQLWDWLELLVLPVAFGVFAVWLKHGRHMSRPRRLALGAAVVAFAAFVAAGYLVPLGWTGFEGNTLWDWLTLLLLPLALLTVRVWPSTARELGRWHVVFLGLLGTALAVTLIGGYAGNWGWTGYPGNTLWDWLQLVLGPVVIATLVIPAAVRWMSGDAERRAAEASPAPPIGDVGGAPPATTHR